MGHVSVIVSRTRATKYVGLGEVLTMINGRCKHFKRKSSYLTCGQFMEYITGGTLLD